MNNIGEAAAWVLDQYSPELGESAAKRCFDLKRYGDILKLARDAALEQIRRRSNSDLHGTRDCLFAFIVAIGKQMGLIRRTCMIARERIRIAMA